MGTMTVRQAILADLEALVSLFDAHRQFYGRARDETAVRDFLRARTNHGKSVLFIAFDGHSPVGFLQLYPRFSSVSLARTFVLNDLFIVEKARRKGRASQLMSAAVEFARSLGAVRTSLSTANTNETAQAVCQSAGWTRDGQFCVDDFAIAAQPLACRAPG